MMTARELWMLASGGMTTHEGLRAATLHSADAIGLSKDIGSFEPGKLADLQVLDKNPLDDIKNSTAIRYVMKNGRLYDANNLRRFGRGQSPCPRSDAGCRSQSPRRRRPHPLSRTSRTPTSCRVLAH